MRRLLILLLMLATLPARGQQLDPEAYIYPIEEVARLYAANFGELRPGHFHAGIDIKTDGVEGKPLVAVADGYISRIVITAGGYGRALYLTLADGKVAVYGHMQRFRDEIEQIADKERRARRSNSLDLHFAPAQWPVRQGERIGYSGNSGSSAGPHLHFELRDRATDRRYNLVREGVIRPEDNLPPRIMRLHYVEVDTLDGVALRSRMQSYSVVRQAEGNYRLTREEPLQVGRRGYFIAEVSDRRNNVHNTFGVWRLRSSVDGVPNFEYRMEGFTYAQAGLCDGVSCYALQRTSRNECFRLARLEGMPADFYPILHEQGVVRTGEGQSREIRIEAEDDCGNRSQLTFRIVGRKGTFRAKSDSTALILRHDRAGVLSVGDAVTARIPAGALFEPVRCHPQRLDAAPALTAEGVAVLSPAYRLLGGETPLRKAMHLSIRTAVPRSLHLKCVAAIRNAKGKWSCAGGSYTAGALTVTTRSTGDVTVVADTLAPRIEPRFEEGADLSGAQALRFRATDNFSGILTWRLTIDGEVVPCDRFPVKGTLVYRFTEAPDRRHHTVRLTVTDGCGNTASWSGRFYR